MNLNDIAEINPKTDVSHLDDNSLVSFIPMSDVTDDGRWVGDDSRKMSLVRHGYTAFADNDVLFAKITPCMENGKGARVDNLSNGIGFGSTEYHVLRARSVDEGEYVFQWTKFKELRGFAANAMTGSAGQQRVPADFLRKYPVFAHMPLERVAVGEVLRKLDRAIEETEALLAKQQRIKTGLMHDLLTRGLDDHGRLRDPSTHRFKNSPVGLTPEEWDTPSLVEHADVMGGKRLPLGHNYSEAETGCLYLRVTDFFRRRPVRETMQRLEHTTFTALQRYEIKDRDLYISIAGSLGYAAVFQDFSSYRVILTENAARIRIRSGFDPYYLSAQINGPLVQPQIDAEAGIGSGVPKLALYRIEGLRIPRPNETEQSEIVKRLHALSSPISDSEQILAKLRRLKSGLMHDLLTGHVPVTPLLTSAKAPISS